MANFEIRIPQLGEGLQEARIVRFLKEPGDTVKQDEIIYEMETDKAVMEIESSVSGILSAWTAKEDDVVPIGDVIGSIETAVNSVPVVRAELSTLAPAVEKSPESGVIELRIPQLGEGLQEARIVQFLKQPGDIINRDEPIYEMETDKAVMEIESPVAGTLIEWTANVDDVLAIGAVIARVSGVSVDAPPAVNRSAAFTPQRARQESTSGANPNVAFTGEIRNAQVPPRTHAYAAAKGISDEELMLLAQSVDGKLLPSDINNYISGNLRDSSTAPAEVKTPSAPMQSKAGPETFVDETLPPKQKTLNFRLQRSAQSVIPATMEIPLNWSAVEEARAKVKASGGEATQFMMFAWCVAQASKDHPRFRTALVNETTLRQYDHLHLGIAVALPGDVLLMARITDADTYGFEQFVETAQSKISLAREGKDQTTDVMQLSLTNMASAGVRTGFPVVVAPSVGTLFIGQTYDEAYRTTTGEVGFRRMANMVFTFDHRVANGIGAARFLNDIKNRVEGFVG